LEVEVKKILAIISLVIIILAGTTVYQFVKKDKYNLVLEIDKDKPLKESLSVLPVSNNPFFKLYLKFRNDGKDIKAGNYELRGKFNMIELVSMLESGKSKVFKFTIIEGNTVKNVIDKLVANGKGTRENFEKALKEIDFPYPTPNGNFEGYLYPETYFIGTWGEQNKALLSALTLEKTIMLVVFSLIAIVAGFLIWITLNTLVREKTKDIGIMRAMGFSKKNIMLIFLIQGIILGIIGIILGIIVSLILLYYIKNYAVDLVSNIYYLKDIPIEISLKEIAIIVGANFIVILISSIFPAYRAARLENVEALRYE